jgi:iron-sulfur cluster assembly accessory protein
MARRFFASGGSKIMKVTPAAVKRLQELISQKGDPHIMGIRVSLARKGCENLSYTMNYTDKQEKLDEVVEADGVNVFVDSKAVMYLIGTEMDYVSNDLMQEFVFYVCKLMVALSYICPRTPTLKVPVVVGKASPFRLNTSQGRFH